MNPDYFEDLRTDIEAILSDTIRFGIGPDQSGRIRLTDVGETIVSAEKWCWITRTRIRRTIAQMADAYTVSDDFIARRNGEMFPSLLEYEEISAPPSEVFVGASKGTVQKFLAGERTPGNGLVRAVGDAEVAACIAIFLTDFGGKTPDTQPAILRIDIAAASAVGPVLKTPSVFFVFDHLTRDCCALFAGAEAALNAATWKVRLNETLHIDDPDRSRIAARSLLRLKPQPEIERVLLSYLQDGDTTVRRNAAQALGLPSFLQGFSLREPTPPREVWLEPGSLQPDSLRKVIEAAEVETDFEVLHWLLCTAGAQYYGGRLKGLVPEMRALTRMLDERFGDAVRYDTKTIRDALSS
jgi:hypothetical protein